MLSASIEFRNKIADNTRLLVKATLELADGTQVDLTGDDILTEGMSFTEATSSGSSFDIGSTVAGELECNLNNYDGRFNDFNFTGATIAPYVGMPMDDGTTEWIRKGLYNVEQPESYGATFSLTCYDNLIKFDRPYSEVDTEFPASAQVVVRDIAQTCGVTIASGSFNNSDIIFDVRPEDENLTCRQMLGYALQATGNYAKCDNIGHLKIGWYDKDAFRHEIGLDGKWFDDAKPYASGDTADGGNFTNYGSGASYDGGEFNVNWQYAIVSAISSQTIGLDDVVITGLKVTSEENPDEEADDDHKYDVAQFGADGYVLNIEGNPLIPYGRAMEFAQKVGPLVVDLRFRIFDIQALGTPVNEAGDSVLIIDAAQQQYQSYITQLTYKPGAMESYSCAGETPARHSATTNGPLAQAVTQFNEKMKKEKTAREQAQEELAKRLEESSGLYKTEVTQEDGSTVYYFHDKPTLEGSMIVWKMTAEAFGISTDGGKTYPYGLDVSGVAILERIYAIGIDANYLTTGRIEAQKGGNFWDLETGELRMAFDGIKDSNGETLQSVIDGMEEEDSKRFRELQDMVSDGTITESEKASIDVMLKRIQAEQVEAVNLYNTIYGNSNLTGTPKTNLYNAKVTLYGTTGTAGSYGNLASQINAIKNSTTAADVKSAMAIYETRYTTYKSHRNTFTQALQKAQEAIETAVAENRAQKAVDAQTQQFVFNKLTNGGKTQGLFIQDGLVYLNATYMRTGYLTDAKGYNYWDLNTGNFRLSPGNVKVGTSSSSETLDAYISDKSTDSFKNATPQEVFNKLTRNGTVHGLVMQNGNLYINAEYIATGIISAVDNSASWNLSTGVFQTHTAETLGGQYHDNYIRLSGDDIFWIMDDTRIGRISTAAVSGDPNVHPFMISAFTYLDLHAPSALRTGYTPPSSNSFYSYATTYNSTFSAYTNLRFENITNGFKVTMLSQKITIRNGLICGWGSEYDNGSFSHWH